jgi:hypothetical protein
MRAGIEEGKEMEKRSWENRKGDGNFSKRELISTIGSNFGMITPCGLSKI